MGGQAGPRVPAEGQANRPQGRDELTGVPRIRRDQGRGTLGENPARTARVPAEELPDRELEMYGVRSPREIRQVALIPTMNRRRRYGTARAGGGRRRRGELEPHRFILNGHFREANPTGAWEKCGDQCLQFMGHNRL
jgi:hypothetical protein